MLIIFQFSLLAHWSDTEAERETRRYLIAQTPICDGSSPDEVRTWILNIDLASWQCPADDVYVATRTVSGALRREVERFIDLVIAQNPGQQRNAVPWNALKQHLVAAFLGGEEIARKRDNIQSIRQKPYESNESFILRFRDAAKDTYPNYEGNADQQAILKQAFLKGLHSDDLVRKVAGRHDVNTLEDAVQWVQNYSNASDRYDRLGRAVPRKEEPMDVSAIQASQTPDPNAPVLSELKKIQGTLKTLNKQQKQQQGELSRQADAAAWCFSSCAVPTPTQNTK